MSQQFMYSFPIVEVGLSALCQVGNHPGNDLKPALIGQVYFFRWNKASDAAKALGMTLDQSLTFDLTQALQSKSLSSPVLVWFGCAQEAFFLWVCGNKATTLIETMIASPGYEESGQDYIAPNAVPFLYWDGQYAYRVYRVDQSIRDEKNWVQDFGNRFTALITPENQDTYERIKANPIEHNNYSAIPAGTELVLRKSQNRVALTQALIKITDNPLQEMGVLE